ncbi:hypothetical protein [Terrisporobacter sp.]|uniref:hypothetical protein n=1 Tax=Terrisporobacter sp. TaxID=1965305 RepID=UPI0026362AA3|nr:hypothetical protein [Terrisporobacter sp.]
MIKKSICDYDGLYRTNEGYFVKVVEYNNYDNVIVEIQDEHKYRVKTGIGNIKKGKVKNPYHRSVHNVGYMGVGEYKSRINYKLTKSYKFWKSMIQRCYDESFQRTHPEYIPCTVCEEWHNYQNFARWFDNNYYEIENRIMNLDKDILYKGNKIYSPNTCVFVPDNINLLFANHNTSRGNFPIGVTFDKKSSKYSAKMNVENKTTHIGMYDNCEDAFLAYKFEKEKYIKKVANKYKSQIPKNLYDALMRWNIEIDD